ncbi:SDR family oxidoreductase [Candidatus Synechococcus calcipolaris G9]|uniref:SDR family oxidoreductase n=1 Tax=Candidatus Synechococcus calcipolaris G9 TaxID=1497997 RepID=A0ABT6EXV1_9SYNE|nr:SDR family oxidoreductase [Candidatus Synechococcus calcipolaris]MDG2990631.1 SDR family oxidoreductase [Candidatus Synechococcus calcipolaris G9]
MRVLILGCGYTGTRLALRLHSQGIGVVITTRSGNCPEVLRDLQPAIAPVPFLWQSSPARSLPPTETWQGVTHVLSSIPPDPVGMDGVVACLMDQLMALDLQWFGYLSTTGVYGDRQGGWVDETTPVHPQNSRSQARVNAENQFLASGLPAHIFRLPGIYGPGSGRNIFSRIQTGKAQHIHRPGHYFCRIHVDDIVQTLFKSLAQPTPGEIYNISDDQPSESSHVLLEAYRLMGQTAPPPLALEELDLSPMAASFWQESRRVRNDRIKSVLGVNLKYPTYREGLASIWNQMAGDVPGAKL